MILDNDKKKLLLLSAAAFLIRIIGTSFGTYHPDEHLVVNHTMAFGTGDLNPHMFYFPSLFLYLVFLIYGIFYVFGHALGVFQNTENFLSFYLSSPQTFYMLGRFVSVIFGTLSVAALYALGKEYKNSRTGLLAALFLTVNFLHSRDSHFAVMDVTLTFFSILSFYFLFRYWNEGRMRFFAAAVFTAGVASAVKYNAFILVLPIVMVYGFKRSETRDWGSAGGAILSLFRDAFLWAGVMGLAFFMFSPYVLLDFNSALDFISRLYRINLGFKVGWLNHLGMLFYSLDAPLFVLSLLGFVTLFFRRRKKDLVLGVFFAIYYGMITRAGQPFERYVLLLVPVSILWAASFLDGLASRRTVILLATLVTLSLLPKTLYSDWLFLQKDTRTQAKEWMQKNIPNGVVVVLDDPGQCPKLAASKSQIEDKLRNLKGSDRLSGVKKRRLEKLLTLEPYLTPSYNLFFLKEDPGESLYQMLGPFVAYDPEKLREIDAQILVTSDKSVEANADFYERFLAEGGQLLAVFDPRRDSRKPMSAADWTYLPIDRFFWNAARPGPLVMIYKVKR